MELNWQISDRLLKKLILNEYNKGNPFIMSTHFANVWNFSKKQSDSKHWNNIYISYTHTHTHTVDMQ